MEAIQIPPNTVKKKKARKVFGDVAADDLDSSLTYSHTSSESLNGTKDGHLPVLEEECDSHSSGSSMSSEKENSNVTHNTSSIAAMNTMTTGSNKTYRAGERNMGLFERSPVRPDLVKKTQDAINRANISMRNFSQSIAAARTAKLDFYHHQRKETAKIKDTWKVDATEAKTLSEITEQNRRTFLALQRQFSSKYSKAKARREQSNRIEVLNHIDKEIQFKSAVHRDHQSKLKKEEDDRRRHSVEARSKIRMNNRMGSEKIRLEKIQEEQAIISERHAASIALRDNIKQNSSQRRQSYVFRNGDARRIRQIHSEMENQRRIDEHNYYNLKWQAENDAKEYIRQELQKRRESLANRNTQARNIRKIENEQHYKILSDEHDSFELKWAAERDVKNTKKLVEDERRNSLQQRNVEGKRHREFFQQQYSEKMSQQHKDFELKWAAEKDTEQYQRELEKERRESLALRNKEGKRCRDYTQQELHKLAIKEHESYELKWAGERDAETYLAQQAKLRRESLEKRNKERVQHAKVIEELRMLALEKESESFALKWAGEKDAKDYLAQLEQERRLSLNLRGKQVLHHRSVESEQHNLKIQSIHEDEVLRAIDQKEMEKFHKQCAERDRASFEYRRKDARLQRIQDEEKSRKLKELEQQNQALETLARVDVVEYINDCKKRKRMSLACRAKEKRKQVEWLRLKKEKELDEQSRRIRDQLLDQKYVELAQQKERARLALNAIRHAGYTFKTNVTSLHVPET